MKAMILAAGLGTRLRPLTEEISKPMVPIANRPVMEHIVELLARHGFDELYVNLHYHPDVITRHFSGGERWGVSITYSLEEELQGTAGGVKRLAGELGGETFLVISGDALTDLDLTSLFAFHRAHGRLATLVITPVSDPSKYGVVITEEDGRITGFQEKPSREEALSFVANSGIYVFEPEVLEMIPAGFYDFGSQLFPRFLEEGIEFYGYRHGDYWNDVGSLEEYKAGNFDALTGKVKVKIPGVRIGEDVWIGDETVVEEEVVMVGPICVGAQCEVRRGARLFGPLVVGDRTIIDEGAILYRGIKWGDGYIGKDAHLLDSIVGWETDIGSGAALLKDTVVGHGTVIGEGSIIHPSVSIMPGSVIEKNHHFRGEPE
ncbi:MAG: NDP-sugar synthase [Actinomycetota bacterium]|nr:NDP-sugar synthase [Actinomycetota bacterium]MDD5666682.1 NDP-sugar synthase [Actinomycetota bacterium]